MYPRVSYVLEKYDIFLLARGKEQRKAKGRNKHIWEYFPWERRSHLKTFVTFVSTASSV